MSSVQAVGTGIKDPDCKRAGKARVDIAAAASAVANLTNREPETLWRTTAWSYCFGPGSVPWLLRHDLKLAGRSMRSAGEQKSRATAAILLFAVVLLHSLGFMVAGVLADLHDRFRVEILVGGSIALVGAFMLFLSKAMSEATDALHQRGDLDLLLSSPLPMRRVLTTRLLSIAVIAGFLPLLIVMPVINGMMLHGYFAWIGLYPVLIGMSLTASALGAGITFGLLAWLGPRWTGLTARALATVFGALSFMFAQIRFLVPDDTRAAVWRAMLPGDEASAMGVQWWPARALLGDTLPMLAIGAIGIAAVICTSTGLGHAYASGMTGQDTTLPRKPPRGLATRFGRGPWGALLRKEGLLLLRHPGLGAQLFYQFVFLVPGVIAMTRVGQAGGVDSPAGVVFLTVMLTGRIVKIIAAAPFECDNAAALAATAPVSPGRVLWAKLAVTVAMLGVVIGLSLGGVFLEMPSALPAAFLACLAATITRLGMAISRPRKLRRGGLEGRMPGHADVLLGVMTDIGWGFVGALLSFFV